MSQSTASYPRKEEGKAQCYFGNPSKMPHFYPKLSTYTRLSVSGSGLDIYVYGLFIFLFLWSWWPFVGLWPSSKDWHITPRLDHSIFRFTILSNVCVVAKRMSSYDFVKSNVPNSELPLSIECASFPEKNLIFTTLYYICVVAKRL